MTDLLRHPADRDTSKDGAVAALDHGPLSTPSPALAGSAIAEERFNANELIRILLKWKWLISGVLLACILGSVIVTLAMTPIFRATVMLQINANTGSVMGARSEVQPATQDSSEFLNTQLGLLRSRSLAEQVAVSLGLVNDTAFAGSGDPGARRRVAAGRIAAGLTIEPQPGSDLVQISYLDANPGRAARIANGIADGFIESNLQRRYDATTFARNFLMARLTAIRARLETTERQLVEYAQAKGLLDLGSDTGGTEGGHGNGDTLSAQSLLALNQALSTATADRITAQQRFREAQASKTTVQVIDNPAIQQLRAQRSLLQADYDQKLATFKPNLPEMIALRSRMKSIDDAIAAQTTSVNGTLRAALSEATSREQQLAAKVASLRGDVFSLRSRGVQYGILQRDADTNRALYDALLQRYKEIGVAGGIGEAQAQIVDRALRPGRPYRPDPLIDLAAGIVLGLVLGFGTAFAIEFIDDTIKSPEDVISRLKTPFLGLTPKLTAAESLGDALADQRSHLSESYVSVLTSLRFSTAHGMPRSVLVTSSRATEGKTSTSLALARAAARIGARVLLIDADLRKPSFTAGTPEGIGLAALLAGADGVMDHVAKTAVSGLSLLPGGHVPCNPAELLAAGRVAEIVAEAIELFDLVVVDAPPVLGLADAPILASICETVVMVVRSGAPRRPALNSLRRLEEARARIAGTVLTMYNVKRDGYGYGYGYGYGERYGEEGSRRALIDMSA